MTSWIMASGGVGRINRSGCISPTFPWAPRVTTTIGWHRPNHQFITFLNTPNGPRAIWGHATATSAGVRKHGDATFALKGKIYEQQEPRLLVRITGQAPLTATAEV